MSLSLAVDTSVASLQRMTLEARGVQSLAGAYATRIDGNRPDLSWAYWEGVRDVWAALHGMAPREVELMCAELGGGRNGA